MDVAEELTSSAAIVTVWFVTMTGRILAFAGHEITVSMCSQCGRRLTSLWVMDENRNIAEGSDRKNSCAAAIK